LELSALELNTLMDRGMKEPETQGNEKPDPPRRLLAASNGSARLASLLQLLVARNSSIKLVLLAIFVVLTVIGIRALYFIDIKAIVELIAERPALSLIIFVAGFTTCTLLLLPTLPLNLLAGALWGPIAGGVISAFATAFAAILCVVLARRFLGPEAARQLLGPNYDLVAAEFERSELLIVALFRLNPAFPAVMNYAFAFVPISAFRFGALSFLFALPVGVAIAGAGEISRVAVLDGVIPDLAHWIVVGLAAAMSAISLAWVLYVRRIRARP
jgi:uncharacterized membrane protein YdjX (TVP38/TMEM64 family)